MVSLLLSLWMAGGAGAALAQSEPDAGATVKAVEARYKDVLSIQAAFTQVTRSEAFGEQRQAGRLQVERPAKMRWDFEGDGRQFLSDGKTMWIYNPADKQVLRYTDFTTSSGGADALLQSLDRLGEFFEVKVMPPEAGNTVLDLKPKKAGQVQSIKLVLKPDYLVEGVTVVDAFGGVTELAFREVKLGGDLPDEQFLFVAPPGVQVVDANAM